MNWGLEVSVLKDEFDDIIYDRARFESPGRETMLLLRKSREEVENMETRVIQCPICHFRCLVGYERAAVHIQFRCNKCKFESPMNLAYFRTQRAKSIAHGRRSIPKKSIR